MTVYVAGVAGLVGPDGLAIVTVTAVLASIVSAPKVKVTVLFVSLVVDVPVTAPPSFTDTPVVWLAGTLYPVGKVTVIVSS